MTPANAPGLPQTPLTKRLFRSNHRIRVSARGLLLAGGGRIGTSLDQKISAAFFCGPAASALHHASELVPLEPGGDFKIGGELSLLPPIPCETPVLLVVNTGGRGFAAGILQD